MPELLAKGAGWIALAVILALLWFAWVYRDKLPKATPKPAVVAHPTPAAPAAGHGAGGHAGGHDDHGKKDHWWFVRLVLTIFLLIGGTMVLAKFWGFDGKPPSLRSHNYDTRFTGRVATPLVVQRDPGVWQFFTSGPETKEPIDSMAGYDTIVCNISIDPKCVDPNTTGYHAWCVPWEGGDAVPYDPVVCKDHRQLLISADKPNTKMAYYHTLRSP